MSGVVVDEAKDSRRSLLRGERPRPRGPHAMIDGVGMKRDEAFKIMLQP
jgi:hypothetical protein